ncbi:MAG: CDP-alcohol phosphatidyltransferase family protein [Bacteroidia bacterium]
MNIKKHIPNAITCGNLLCGCLAIVKAFEGNLVWAAYLVGIALVLDFFDGFTARLLKVSSPIGKDLDSLADMVTFGVVPGIVMFKLIFLAVAYDEGTYSDRSWISDNLTKLTYFAFIIPIFSAVRLAKFNNDTRQSDSFIGVPTPANAMFICSIPVIYHLNGVATDMPFTESPYVLCFVSLIMSLLLVAPIPLLALKFKNFSWADNKMRFILIGLAIVTLAVFQFVGIPLVIILYILLSIVNNIFFKKKV